MPSKPGSLWKLLVLAIVVLCVIWYVYAYKAEQDRKARLEVPVPTFREAGEAARQGYEKSKELVKEGLDKTKEVAVEGLEKGKEVTQEGLVKTQEAAADFKKGWDEGGKKEAGQKGR